MYSVTTINSTLTAPPQRVELSCGEGSFICLHLDLKSWLGFYTQFFYKFLHLILHQLFTLSTICLESSSHPGRIQGTFLTQLIGLQFYGTIIVSISIYFMWSDAIGWLYSVVRWVHSAVGWY